MKNYIKFMLLGCIIVSCDCADERVNSESITIYKSWRLNQKIYEGNVVIFDKDVHHTFTLNHDFTFDKSEHQGTFLHSGDEITLISATDTIKGTVEHLSDNALALQLHYDVDHDGNIESVRESYSRLD